MISSGFLGPTHGSLPSRGLVNADDLVSILQYMARWQQEDDRRVAVLLESSNSQSCASFRISPKITDDEAHDVWNKDRCSFTGLLCGSTVNTIERFDSRPFMQLQKGEFAADFRSENQLFEHHDVQLCLRPCIWHFSYRAAAVMSTASYSYAQPAQLILSSIVQPDYSLESIIVGPIVSNVTPHSATVLLEGSVSNMCVIKCIEASSGVEFVCSNFMRKHEPTFFHFEGLSPNRHYQLTIADSPTICGSFSTLLTVPSDEMPDPFHRARVREAVGADESEGTSGESFRILIIGIMSTSEDKPAILQSSLSDIRGMHDLQDLLSLPWSGFDLVLHFGGISNWRAALDTAISDLSLLEQLNKNSMQQEVGGLQAKVEGYFRESIRSFLGANSHVRSLLCNGSHRFVSDPVVELLGGMNAPSLSVLSRDLSPFCLDTLLAAVRRAHALYMEPQSTICWIIQGPCCIYNMHLQLRCGGEYTNAFNCIGRDSLDKLDSVLTALPTSIHTLALVCSLPIVPAQRLYSSYSDLRFSHLDTVGILDVVWKWARESSSRQAVLVGSEAGRSRRLTISIRAGDVMTRKLSQICIGSRPDMETHARHPEESYDLVSKMWSDVVFSVSPEPDEGSGTVGVVEVPMVSLPDSHASFQWLTQDDMRSRSMAIADDCCASTRIQVDPVLNKLLDIAGESYSNAEFEAALESESDAFAAAVGFASSLPVPSRCSAIGFLQRVGGVVSTNFSPGIRNIVHQPTAVSAALAWKQFTSEQLRSGRSWSDCLVALHQDATVLVSLLKAMFSLQLKLQLLSWEAGCLD